MAIGTFTLDSAQRLSFFLPRKSEIVYGVVAKFGPCQLGDALLGLQPNSTAYESETKYPASRLTRSLAGVEALPPDGEPDGLPMSQPVQHLGENVQGFSLDDSRLRIKPLLSSSEMRQRACSHNVGPLFDLGTFDTQP